MKCRDELSINAPFIMLISSTVPFVLKSISFDGRNVLSGKAIGSYMKRHGVAFYRVQSLLAPLSLSIPVLVEYSESLTTKTIISTAVVSRRGRQMMRYNAGHIILFNDFF